MFELPAGKMELGLGIHGEPGLERANLTSAHDLVNTILTKLTASKRLELTKKEPLAVLVNNLGSVSQLEFGIVQGEVVEWFCEFSIQSIIIFTFSEKRLQSSSHLFRDSYDFS
jgi:dihydroxyacetone kinase